MKSTLFHQVTLTFMAAGLLALAAPAARADGRYIFEPVWTQRTVDSLKTGDQVQIKCAECGGVTTVTIDKDKKVLKYYKCAGCGAEYHLKRRAHGKLALVDSKGMMAEISVPTHAPVHR